LFCGEAFFRHDLPFERSSITRWRQRMGEDKIVALIQESLNIATRVGQAFGLRRFRPTPSSCIARGKNWCDWTVLKTSPNRLLSDSLVPERGI
jgi:hypothetical protein